MKSTALLSLIALALLVAVGTVGSPPSARAQVAAPGDRNTVNTAARPSDMMTDSPVTFPKQGALPAKFPSDVLERSEPAEKDYYLFSSPCRSLAQIRAIQQEMPKGEFAPPPGASLAPPGVAGLALTRPSGTLSHRMGEGRGEGRFMGSSLACWP